ncbi:D-lactaldehyde dehydrogenase [Russula compacta]|nr:D-lactaldehyde dehydrogenase [Russula compacta]
MVAISPPAKVLVTGANGYLAVWVVKKYLEAGYSVRGTVRSLSKSAFLKDNFGHYGDRFELVVVEDITKDGAFDEAVKGVDAIAHTASPVHLNAKSPDDVIIPAVQGTTSILNSALKHRNTIKRFVLTSSTAAVCNVSVQVAASFNESNWNDASVEAVNTKGLEAGPFAIYQASKTLAEKAAWDFVAAHKSEISWDLVALNPPWISGYNFSPAPTVNDINVSQREVYDALTGARTAQLQGQGNWVHVALVAEAHVRATHAAAAGGERIIVRSGHFYYQDFLDAATELGIPKVPRGEPGSTKDIPATNIMQTTKAEDLLGLTQVTALKDVVAESVEDFKARGYPGFTA